MCPICKGKLIPILYGYVDKKYLDMHEAGLILLMPNLYHKKTDPKSYCKVCDESFDIKIDQI